MKPLFCLPFLFLGFLTTQHLRAQVGPPTLTAGIGSIVYERGQLDAELIASVIAEKQNEIQAELAQRYILNSLECGSFSLWNYVRQNLEILFYEVDPDVMTKEILRYGAELALVYGMSEYYVQDLAAKARRRALSEAEEEFLQFIFYWLDDAGKASLGAFLPDEEHDLDECIRQFIGQCSYGAQSDSLSFEDYVMAFILEGEGRQAFFQQVEEQSGAFRLHLTPEGRERLQQLVAGRPEVVTFQMRTAAQLDRALYLPRPEFLTRLKNTRQDFNESELTGAFAAGCGNISPNHILVDLIYEVARSSEAVQRAGFFQDIGTAPEAYRVRNKYLLLAGEVGGNLPLEQIREEVETIIELLFGFYQTLDYLRESELDLTVENIDDLLLTLPETSIPDLQEAMQLALTNLGETLSVRYEFDEADRYILDNLLTIIRDRRITRDELDSYAYFIDTELIPQLIELNFATRGAFDLLLLESENLVGALRRDALLLIREQLEDERISRGVVQFVELINLLNNLDEVETYEYIFNFPVDVGNITSSERARTIINAIANGVDRYLVIDRGENVLKLEVTSFAADIFNRFGQRTGNRWSFYFSVGLNNAFAPRAVAESFFDSTQHIYYASEKVGVKFKLIDWRRQYAYGDFDLSADRPDEQLRRKTGRIDRQPIVSDLYAIASLSGLLYQLDVLRSENSFTDPTLNLGLGVAFFNDLDLNLNYTVPFGRQFIGEGLLNLSLEIRITEYLSRLRRRQRGE